MAARFAWVSLQSLNKMSKYLANKIRNHPGITSTRVRFLISTQSESSPSGLKSKLDGLDTKVKNPEKMATKESLQKLDNKVEGVIRANNLKKGN